MLECEAMTRAIRLLAIDLDGTLLNSQFEVSARDRDAVVAAARLGVEIVLITGRRYATACKMAAQLPVEATVISSSGALIRDARGATLRRHLLPAAKARAVLEATHPAPGSALLLFDRNGKGEVVTEGLDPAHEPIAGYFQRNQEYLEPVVPLTAALTEDPIEVLFIGAVEAVRELAQRLARAPVAASVSVGLAEYPQRDLSLLDVLDRGCHKGAALAWLAGQRSINREEVMAIGDNWNDREMLEFSGLPVLMANSSEELKRSGWAVTASNDENGVAAAIERFLLSD